MPVSVLRWTLYGVWSLVKAVRHPVLPSFACMLYLIYHIGFDAGILSAFLPVQSSRFIAVQKRFTAAVDVLEGLDTPLGCNWMNRQTKALR